MFPRAIPLFRIGRVDVRVDRSWFVIALLIVLSFQSRWAEQFGGGPALVMAVVGALLFFVSLLAHELGHALEARHRGIEVGGITLFVLGGVTEMHDDAPTPRAEFAIAAVGPFLSLVAAAAFGLAATGFDQFLDVPEAEHVLGLLGWLNVGLAVFNMVPGSPLDGGRVLRALLWAVTGDRRRAISLSARAGQVLAVAVAGLALYALLEGRIGQAMVNLLVAWFLWAAAQSERRHAALDRLLEGHRAGALELEPSEPVPADHSVAALAQELDDVGSGPEPAARPRRRRSPATDPDVPDRVRVRPVVDEDGVVGAIVLSELAEMHPQDRTFRVARDVMRPADDLPRIAADTPVWDLLRTFQEQPLVLLDLDDGRTTTLTAREFAAALERLRRRRRSGVRMGVEAT